MKNKAGFSLVELLMAVAIVMVLAVIGVPNIVTTIANVRLRGSMTSLSGVMQNSRTLAVKINQTTTTRFISEPHGLIAYVKHATDTTNLKSSDPQVQLQAPISRELTLTGPGAPIAIDAAILSFTPTTGNASFNSRGLPCAYSAGNCPSRGFIYYFKDTRSVGENGWAALSISPAGRIKKWFWTGDNWVD